MKPLFLWALMALTLMAAPTCSVEPTDDMYTVTITGDPDRPDTFTEISRPSLIPVTVFDSYFSGCIIYAEMEDGGGILHTFVDDNVSFPVQGSLVTMSNPRWKVETRTDEAGCFWAKVPANDEMTLEAEYIDKDDPEDAPRSIARYGHLLQTADVGQTTNECRANNVPGTENFLLTTKWNKNYIDVEYLPPTISYKMTLTRESLGGNININFDTVKDKTYVISGIVLENTMNTITLAGRVSGASTVLGTDKRITDGPFTHEFKATTDKTAAMFIFGGTTGNSASFANLEVREKR